MSPEWDLAAGSGCQIRLPDHAVEYGFSDFHLGGSENGGPVQRCLQGCLQLLACGVWVTGSHTAMTNDVTISSNVGHGQVMADADA